MVRFYHLIALINTNTGQTFPVTALGKIVATVTALVGVLVIAFPVAVLGTLFKDQWKIYEDRQKEKRQKKKLKKKVKKSEAGKAF